MKRHVSNRLTTLAVAALLGTSLLALGAADAEARRRGGHGPAPEIAAERLAEELDLTAEQQEQVQQILEAQRAARDDLRSRHRDDMEAFRDETHARLGAVLTPDQMVQLEDLRAARREWREERRERRGDRYDCGDCSGRGGCEPGYDCGRGHRSGKRCWED